MRLLALCLLVGCKPAPPRPYVPPPPPRPQVQEEQEDCDLDDLIEGDEDCYGVDLERKKKKTPVIIHRPVVVEKRVYVPVPVPAPKPAVKAPPPAPKPSPRPFTFRRTTTIRTK